MSTPTNPVSSSPRLRPAAPQATSASRRPVRGNNAKSVDGPDFRQVFEQTAKRISSGQRRVDRALRMARSGTMSNEQLLVLQTTVYRFTQEVEMASKLVDKATGALRQTLQSQQ